MNKLTAFNAAIEFNHLDIDVQTIYRDEDICDKTKLQSLFNKPYHLESEQAISLSNNYVLQMSVAGTQTLTIALGVSDNTCVVYKLNDLSFDKISNISGHAKPISEIVFDPTNENLLYTSSLDATVKLWDLRDPTKCVNTYVEQENITAPILSFDVSSNGGFLCGGTEVVNNDSFILFWDARSSKLLGGYWESHDDDITQVKFHKTKPNSVATGSTDGLINIFDVSLPDEETALQISYNTESSVQTINWFLKDNNKDVISCITHTNDLQLWDVQESEKIYHFPRAEIAQTLQRRHVEDCYIINTHQNKDKEFIVLAGSHAKNGKCLRSLTKGNKELKPHAQFLNNKQIVRCSWHDPDNDMFITAGECGIVSVWKSGCPLKSTKKKNMKSDAKFIAHKAKPY